MLIPSEKVVIQALAHDIRQTILKVLQARAYSFSELMKLLNVPSGKLNYHLSQIAGFIHKNVETGMYETTILGSKAIDFLNLLQSHLTPSETPFLCEAFISQMAGKEGVQQFRQSYLLGIIQAARLIQRLKNLDKHQADPQELLNFMFEIEAKVRRILLSIQRKHKTPFSDPKIDYWQGVFSVVNQAKNQLIQQPQYLPQLLSHLELQAEVLQQQLARTDLGVTTFSPEEEDLEEELDLKQRGNTLEG